MCNEKLLVANYIVFTLVPVEVDIQIIEVGKDAKKLILKDTKYADICVADDSSVRGLCRPKFKKHQFTLMKFSSQALYAAAVLLLLLI
jgi:hypothetical protein